MQIGFVGLGKMGGTMVERLLRDKHEIVIFNRTPDKVREYAKKGAVSYAEGFDTLRASPYGLDLQRIAHLWNQGSVVRSWLLELIESALLKDPGPERLEPCVADSEEGRRTVFESIESDVPAPVLTLALQERFASRDKNSFAHRLLAALRNEFGGHAIKAKP